jgi:hypothetical protein
MTAHRRVFRWKPLLAALAQVAVSGGFAVLVSPKWGAAIAVLGILVQSQLRPVARREPTHPTPLTPPPAPTLDTAA